MFVGAKEAFEQAALALFLLDLLERASSVGRGVLQFIQAAVRASLQTHGCRAAAAEASAAPRDAATNSGSSSSSLPRGLEAGGAEWPEREEEEIADAASELRC